MASLTASSCAAKLCLFKVRNGDGSTCAYTWGVNGDWSECPDDCGQAIGDYQSTREVVCTDASGNYVNADNCDTTQMLDQVKDCPATDPCKNSSNKKDKEKDYFWLNCNSVMQ